MNQFQIIQMKTSAFDEIWNPVWGETRTIRNCYNELVVELRQIGTNRLMNLRFRVYDEGIGFRYEFPLQQELDYFIVKEEHSQFAMTGDHMAFWIPGD